MSYFMVDVESDGPIPGDYSMGRRKRDGGLIDRDAVRRSQHHLIDPRPLFSIIDPRPLFSIDSEDRLTRILFKAAKEAVRNLYRAKGVSEIEKLTSLDQLHEEISELIGKLSEQESIE